MKKLTDEQAVTIGRKARQLINQGLSKNKACEALKVNNKTLNHYLGLWDEGGAQAIMKHRAEGRKKQATAVSGGDRKRKPVSALDVDYLECDVWNFAIFGSKCKLSAEMSL